jgi:hypothetical protein
MGSEDLVERRIELFQRSETETLTVGSGGKLGEIVRQRKNNINI